MTNQAISAILDHLCNEARNSAQATFGVRELLRELGTDSARQAAVAIGSNSADQLLRSIDDVRELLSTAPGPPALIEEFDLALCAGEIIEVLTLTSRRRAKHMILDAPPEPVLVTQDRKAVEQVFTRILGTAFKLAQTCEVHAGLSPTAGHKGVRLTIAARDIDLASRLAGWLNADPDQASLQDSEDVPFEIAVMVAGKRLRAMGGVAGVVRDAAGHCAVTLDVPSLTEDGCLEDRVPSFQEAQPDTLNILVAEDCDDSFAVSALALQNENVWRARDGQEAIRMVQKQRFDVVIMDVHMPLVDGYTAIRNIRDWETEICNARTPMVILSSDDLETQRRSAAECGCSGFLRKPMRRGDLSGLLDQLKTARTLVVN